MANLRNLLNAATDAIVVVDEARLVCFANPAAEALFNIAPGGLLGIPFDYSLSEKTADINVVRPGGEKVSVEMQTSATVWDGKKACLAIFRDITSRKKLQSELRNLANRLMEQQEEERQAIARELHDDIGQQLTILKLLLEKTRRSLSGPVLNELKEAEANATDILSRVRNLCHSLQPGMLNDLGLLATLLWYFDEFGKKTGIAIDFKHTGLEREFPRQVKIAAYRIIQEALTNVEHHARIHQASVFIEVSPSSINLWVKDNGAGFDPAAISPNSSGLCAMRQRTEYLGGTFSIESAPRKGSCLQVSLPLV